MMYVFNTCRPFIRTIPSLVYDRINAEDIDSSQEDHDYDACRYFLMTNPINPHPPAADPAFVYNPLA